MTVIVSQKKSDYSKLKEIIPRLKNLKFVTVEYYKKLDILEKICINLKKINKKIK